MSNTGPKSLPEGARIEKIIHTGFFCPREFNLDGELDWGAPLYFIGPPGATKTTKLSRFTKQFVTRSGGKVPFEGMKPGARGDGQFGVIPVPVPFNVNGKEVTVLDYPPPRFMVDKFASGVGLVLVDEMTTAPPALQPALLGLTHEKEIGTWRLPPRVRVFGAGNAVSEAANGTEIPMPQANRFIHIPWPDPSAQEIANYMSAGITDDNSKPVVIEDVERRVLEAWPTVFPNISGMIAGFLHKRPSLVRNQPPPESPDASGAWASPRTWMFAAQLYAAAKIHECNAVETELLISGALGHGVMQELEAYRSKLDLPDPLELLDGKEFRHDPYRLDRTVAVLNACLAFLQQTNLPKRIERMQQFAKIAVETSNVGCSDLVYPVITSLVANHNSNNAGILLNGGEYGRKLLGALMPLTKIQQLEASKA